MPCSPSSTRTARRSRLGLALLASAAATAALAPSAEAAFVSPACQGTAINGRGASFAASAHAGWIQNFRTADFCGETGPGVSYDPAGSGAGRRAVGERSGTNTAGNRDASIRFGMSDEPPTPTQQGQINNGTDSAGDEGRVHVLPMAGGSVPIIINYPNGCTIPTDAQVDPGAADQTTRFRVPNPRLEAAFAGDSSMDTWGELLPGISGRAADDSRGACAAQIIRRVVRFDSSGTTFAIKDWLSTQQPAGANRGWNTTLSNTAWPNNNDAPPVQGTDVLRGGQQQDGTGGANGNGPLAQTLNATDGGIGYGDLSTARSFGFQKTPNTADDTYWIPVQNGSGAYTEPTEDPQSFKNSATGSNCTQTVYRNVPGQGPNGEPATLGDWSQVTGVNATEGFGICTLTYMLAFDDHAVVYGNNDAEEKKARTVKDYLNSIVSSAGQALLRGRDYGPLPATGSQNLLATARAGVSSVDWNKAGGGGGGSTTGGGTTGGGTTGGGTTGGGTTGGPPPIVQPSNVFSITSVRVTKTGRATLSIRVPGPGRLEATGAGISPRSVPVSAAGTVRITVRASRAVTRTLRRRGRARTGVLVRFTPTNGTANSVTRSITFKGKKSRRRIR